jgi:hypothetical protein
MSGPGCEFGIERKIDSFYPGISNFTGRKTGTWETLLENWISYLGLESIVQKIGYDANKLTPVIISKSFRGMFYELLHRL